MSKLARAMKWEKINNNYVLRIDDEHFISYNSDTGNSRFGAMLDSIIGQSGEETALVDHTNSQHEYRILIGDWRNDYEKLAQHNFEDCIDFFMDKRKEFGGQWSTHENDRA